MKNLFILILFVSGITFAKPQDRVVAQVVGVDAAITSVLLTESGRLVVVNKDKKAESLFLAASVKHEMLDAVQMLGQADISVDRREVICMMILPVHSMQNLKVLDAATNTLKLVLSNNSCAMSEYVYPTDLQMLEQAQTLKSQLVILAKQLVK